MGDTRDRYRSGAYGADNPTWHAEDAAHKASAVAALVRFGGLTPATIIDVGCGSGDLIRLMRESLGPRLPETVWTGWDIAPEAIARAEVHADEGLRYVCGDFLASDATADLLLAIDVVEHVVDDVAFLRALGQRSGRMVLRIPLDLSALDVVRPSRLIHARRVYGHRHLYTRDIALDLLAEAGLEVEVCQFDRVPPPQDTPRRRWVDRARRTLFSSWPDATVRILGGWSLLVLVRPR